MSRREDAYCYGGLICGRQAAMGARERGKNEGIWCWKQNDKLRAHLKVLAQKRDKSDKGRAGVSMRSNGVEMRTKPRDRDLEIET